MASSVNLGSLALLGFKLLARRARPSHGRVSVSVKWRTQR